ncbi:MAG: bifunctional helix-turn-helix transcriptional regulator/GNAT family N-acetyltransferase [Alphaproteobacteria bacterium]|jgi:DNA-binding MarR family transcriptional regulator/GNAT superfamily N-acetyltransferase|nr:bifunctional helix-turn-helix transcriptional regulator/GNAT family N-acetyltransferase [Alphaproteobacteria bacterium]MDP6813254.1 bifunctional helix-turn-helix transcriptional regulator/GNAT family N-acetyltransferase [Alphaproteobacteria bacterium]
MDLTEGDLPRRIEAVRRFNRFYTKQIGVLREGLLQSPFSLTQARIIYELAHRDTATASQLGDELNLDRGYLSRILRGFATKGLIDRTPSPEDGRQTVLRLSDRGREAFAMLNARSRTEIAAMLDSLAAEDQDRLLHAMNVIRRLLGGAPDRPTPLLLRQHEPGDMGWVASRHGLLYAEEFGWDEQFEALVAGIVGDFLKHYDGKLERCWIAELDGDVVGSVFVVKHSPTIAQLRLLLVEPKARGHGIGGRLIDECLRFARRAGYRKMTLWTNSVLLSARRLYQAAGFRLIAEEAHHSFGHDLVGETWELDLRSAAGAGNRDRSRGDDPA